MRDGLHSEAFGAQVDNCNAKDQPETSGEDDKRSSNVGDQSRIDRSLEGDRYGLDFATNLHSDNL